MNRAGFAARLSLFTLGLGVAALPAQAQVAVVPPLVSFTGRLVNPAGNPVPDGNYSIRFSLWDAVSAGTEKWNQTIATVAVKNGTFSTLLLVNTAGLFNGNLWLEIKVGADAAQTPRVQLVSVAYALKAQTVPDGSIGATQIADGAITAAKLAQGLGGTGWGLTGNAGINPVTNFLGTTDNQPLVFKVNGRQAMRLQFSERTGSQYRGINILGGSDLNAITAGVVGATVAGGGLDVFTGTDYPNKVTEDFGTVGGGFDNIAGFAGVIAGGERNRVSNVAASIMGGHANTSSGFVSSVAGGEFNTASGDYSFAAGRRSQAIHGGSFVWGDNTDANFDSTGPNQFLIRAGGGVKLKGSGATGTYLELGFGVAKEGNAGKIGYALFSPDALDIVGAGMFSSGSLNARRVKIWAEQGTTFTGGINTTSAISNGVSGATSLSFNAGVYGAAENSQAFGVTGKHNATGNIGYLGTGGAGVLGQGSNAGSPGGYFKNSAGGLGLLVEGTASVGVLEIRGGADLAERFAMTGTIEPGMVVEIDPDNEGKLRLSCGAFNRRVAGVVSGAKNLSAGVIFTDPADTSKNSLPVAMSGRVWVYTDATERAVEPGDFLTTAEKAGFAMPVSDLAKAQGAILGKAMTRLAKGKVGLVLVLVNLQ